MQWTRVVLAAVAAVVCATVGSPAAPDSAAPPVDYLARAPVVDGRLDAGLERLPRRAFAVAAATDPALEPGDAGYRLAYGADFLYLFVEAAGERLTFRDRAYQHGDGFHLVLAAPTPDGSPSREFYVIAASAVDRPEMEWSRRIIWYRNVTDLFLPLGPGARMEAAAAEGRLGFELLLPWSEVPPLHPWLSDGIGFNLALVRAAGERDEVHHLVVPDERIQSEQSPRVWVLLTFAPPPPEGVVAFVQLERGHVDAGAAVRAAVAGRCAAGATLPVRLVLEAGEGGRLATERASVPCSDGLVRSTVDLPTEELPPGGYRVGWQAAGVHGEAAFTVLPPDGPQALRARLEAVAGRLPAGSRDTLAFRIEEAAAGLAALHPYETAGAARLALAALADDLARAEAGEDPTALVPGTHRRAFRSPRDGTLQPYVVRVPDAPLPSPAPLVVYLHGSGSDERSLPPTERVAAERALELAPRGRGTSHAWAPEEARRDVLEAVDALARETPVDPRRVVLAGFSMGGYGVLRTFLDDPGRFAGVAVFSGHPDLANRWLGGGQPSFLDPTVQAVFAGVPVFVFHGTEDRNCPYELVLQMVEGLRAAGADVTFVAEAGAGHQAPGPEAVEAYHRWLAERLGPDAS